MRLTPTIRRREPGLFPFRDWDLLEDQMERLMRRLPLAEPSEEPFVWAPRVDFVEENGAFVLTAELPGIDPKDVDIEVEGNTLMVRGEKKIEREHEDERVRLSERTYGSFERSFTLPSSADPDKVDADFRNGVLRIHIQKRPEARGRKIQVQAKQ